jgi:hypothetical protein
MANFWYTEACRALANKELDLDTDDLRVLLVMTNTTADTEREATTIAGFTTLDEFNGANYSSPGIAITGKAIAADGTNHRANVTASAVTWTALGAGSRAIQAALIYKFSSTLGASMPIAFIDTGGFPITASGADLTITWNAAGMLQVGPST